MNQPNPNLDPVGYKAQRNEGMIHNYRRVAEYLEFIAHEIEEDRIEPVVMSETTKNLAKVLWNFGMAWMNEAILWHQIDKRGKMAVTEAENSIGGLMESVEQFLGTVIEG